MRETPLKPTHWLSERPWFVALTTAWLAREMLEMALGAPSAHTAPLMEVGPVKGPRTALA